MPDPDESHSWTEISISEAKSLWKVSPSMNDKKKAYTYADVYEKENKTITRYKNCFIDHFDNIYENLGASYNYVICYGVTEITLNKISPTVAGIEDAKIYKTTSDSSLLKFVTADNETYITKNGWLLQFKNSNRTVSVKYQ